MRAEAPTGYDRGEAPLVPATQQGATVEINVTLSGTGGVSGLALDHTGAPLQTGTVTFTNDEWGSVETITAPVQSNGRYEINAAPAGPFAQVAAPDRVGSGRASANSRRATLASTCSSTTRAPSRARRTETLFH